MADDGNEKKLVGVRITEERRQNWKEQIEDSNEFNSMAQAMRVGFERLFDEDQGASEFQAQEIKERLDKIEEKVEKNQQEIERIPFQYPSLEEISEEVVYRLAEVGEEKKQEGGRY